MIELAAFGRDRFLGRVLEEPWLQPSNGVHGVAVLYDERLVAEAARLASWPFAHGGDGSVQQSRHVAMLLAAVLGRLESGPAYGAATAAAPESGIGDGLFKWWQALTKRSAAADRSPIIVEVSLGPHFPRETRPELGRIMDSPYRMRFRRSAGGKLHAAVAGGRIDRTRSEARIYGTTGGFILDNLSGEIFSVTAAHVCQEGPGKAMALPPAGFPSPVRNGLRHLLSALPFGDYRPELCPHYWSSSPDAMPSPGLATGWSMDGEGLDVALHLVSPKPQLVPVEVIEVADLSPVLDLRFTGAASGYRRVAVSSYSFWHSYELGGQQVCVRDCIQVRLRDRPYVRTDVSQGGDSGAWLTADDRSAWAGLLTGGDGDRAGFVPARRIVDRVERDLRPSVTAMM